MRILFLFYTQAESGAPGYLSRRGEDAAGNLCESLIQFLTETLSVDLQSGLEQRARSVDEDLRWRAFKKPEALGQAIGSTLALFPDVLLMAGQEERTLKTAERLASALALPVCVDQRIDANPDDPKRRSTGGLQDALTDLLQKWLQEAHAPRSVVVGTSKAALLDWLKDWTTPEKHEALQDTLDKVTAQDSCPTVFACGYEGLSGEQGTWLFD